jgi:thiol-disulfide isomerase/thioredoxin
MRVITPQKIILPLCLIILMVSLFSGCTEENNESPPIVKSGLTFTTIEGEQKDLSDYKGSVVILDMWATWCGPCQYQIVALKDIYDTYHASGVEILSIDMDATETRAQVIDFLDGFESILGYNFEWTFGTDDGKIWTTYHGELNAIPTLCIFDTNGNVYYKHEGYEDSETIASQLDDLLG